MKLNYELKNIWEEVDEKTYEDIFYFSEDYKKFLDNSKTERWATREIVKRLEDSGFENIENLIKKRKKIKAGDKLYKVNKEKNVAAFVIGKEDISEGLNIIGSHLDSPRDRKSVV